MPRPKGSKNKKAVKYDPKAHDPKYTIQSITSPGGLDLQKHEPKGLGDIVEEVFKYTGVKALVKHIAGEDCGCDERKENLNEFGKKITDKLRTAFVTKPLPLTLEEYEYIKSVTDKNPRVLQKDEVTEFYKIHNRVFRTNLEITGCNDCVKKVYGKISQLVKIYEG